MHRRSEEAREVALRLARAKLLEALAIIDAELGQLESRTGSTDPPAPIDDAGAFMTDCIVRAGDDYRLAGEPLYRLYVAWCERRRERARDVTWFGRRLRALGYRKERKDRVTYLGLGLSEVGRTIAREADLDIGRLVVGSR